MESLCYGVIYKTTNLINGSIYIGQTIKKGGQLNYYLGSGKLIKKAIKKYGRKNFEKEVICVCNNEDQLNRMERLYISLLKPDYNIAEGGFLLRGRPNPSNDPLVRLKISNTLKGRRVSEKTRKALLTSSCTRVHTIESNKKCRKTNIETYMKINKFIVGIKDNKQKVFMSMRDASRYYNLTVNFISKCITHPDRIRRKYKNVDFRYATEKEKEDYIYNYYNNDKENI